MKKKFWCHYIGNDGNTPKRRSIELTNLADLVPVIGDNEHCDTPLWYETEDSYGSKLYYLYAQLSDNVATLLRKTINDNYVEMMLATDEDIEKEHHEWYEQKYSDPNLHDYYKHPEEDKEYVEQRIKEDKECRKRYLSEIARLQDYTTYLLTSAKWITKSELRAYEEAQSPFLSTLQSMRKQFEAQREEENRQRREEERKRAEEEAKHKAEEERKEQERLTQEAEKFKNGEHISGSDVVDLCRRYGIKVHLRTIHNLQQVVYDIDYSGHCRYYRTSSKRRPVLDGCYKTAEELYEYLKNHPTKTTEICE